MSHLSSVRTSEHKLQHPPAPSMDREGMLKPSSLVHSILALQHTAGNQAITHLLQRGQDNPSSIGLLLDAKTRAADRPPASLLRQQVVIAKPAAVGVLRGKCTCDQPVIAGDECEECRQKREGTVQRSAVNASPAHSVPPIVHDVLNSPGHPLDAGARAIMEPRFGHDFSGVRVHTDVKAAESAHAVNALAYTVGSDIVFGTGQYAPETKEGEQLLAHELTHVVQQKSEIYRSPATLEMTNPEDTSEREAQVATNVVMQDQPFAPISRGSFKVARQGTPSQKSALPPTVFKHNTELGGLIVGNFDFHFRECGILVWVWLKFQFTKDINATEQADFKERFLNAVHSKWAHSGYSLTGTGNCPCGMIPIEIHAEENTGSYYHKLVDVERKTDVERRPKVISDINVNLYSDDLTLAHEFGHVLGLYDEYDGGFFENIMFWHENPPGGDPEALMSTGTELRPRYFEHYRREVQKTAPKGCQYTISSPVPPGS